LLSLKAFAIIGNSSLSSSDADEAALEDAAYRAYSLGHSWSSNGDSDDYVPGPISSRPLHVSAEQSGEDVNDGPSTPRHAPVPVPSDEDEDRTPRPATVPLRPLNANPNPAVEATPLVEHSSAGAGDHGT
jgi:hypothetical protein